MAWTFSDQGNGNAWTTGSIAATAVSVSAGDLIVVSIGSIAAGVYCTGVTDTQGNTYTVRSAVVGTNNHLVMAYCIGAAANAANIIIATFNNADAASKSIIASVYTPDGGETVTLDVTMNKAGSWEAAPWETGTDDTTGTDEVCVVGLQGGTATITYTNHEIPGATAATELTAPGRGGGGWYRILTATASGLYAEVDPSGSHYYSIEMLCFKSVAGGEEHVKNLSDTINLSDVCVFLLGLNKSDSMFFSDSQIKNIGRSLTDSISMSDGIVKNVGWSEADSITMSDGIAKTPGLPKADTITLSDNASMVASFLRSLNDTINLSDDMVKSYRTTKADIVTMSDSVAKLFGLSINDVTSLSEIIVKQIGTPKADSITLSDDITKNFGVTKSDTITLSDNLVSIIITLILNLNDTINLSDDIVKNVGTARADTINISDNFSKVIAYLRSFADTITLSDLGLREVGLNKTDTITISDGIAKTPGLSSTDTITLSENIAKELGLNKTDTITLSDFFSSDAGGALLFIIEQLGLSPISGIF